jgi:hypothetical protein
MLLPPAGHPRSAPAGEQHTQRANLLTPRGRQPRRVAARTGPDPPTLAGVRRIAIGVLAAVGAFGVVAAGPAGAQAPTTGATVATATPPPSGVAAAIADAGWYADGGAVGDREQLADVAERLASEGHHLGFALLASEPAGNSTVYADEVLDALPGLGERTIRTVVVLSDADVGVVSDEWSDGAIDAALDDTIDDLRADPTDGLEALAGSLAGQPAGTDAGDDDGGPSSGLLAVGVIALVGLSLGSRLLRRGGGDGDGDGYDDSYGSGSSWRGRRSSYRSSSRRSFSSRSRRRSSSGGSRRGRGGRRL